jgi:hypothetical protein
LVLPACFAFASALVFATASVILGGCGSSRDSNGVSEAQRSTPAEYAAAAHDGELKLGNAATVGGTRVRVKSVTYGLSECQQQLGSSDLRVKAGYECICLEWDEEDVPQKEGEMEGLAATPGKRYETIVVDSAGEEHEGGVFLVTSSGSGIKATFGIPQARGAVAFIYRDSRTGEEARWSLK